MIRITCPICWYKLKEFKPESPKKDPYMVYLIASKKQVEWKMAYYQDGRFWYTPLMPIDDVIWWAEKPIHPKKLVIK